MPDAGPAISVVIPTRQRRESVMRTLAALAGSNTESVLFEVIVSIDGSSDGTSEAVAAYDAPYAISAVLGPARGRAAACNAAIARAKGEVIVILDDDMEPAPGCLLSHVRNHPPGSRVCAIGPVPVLLDSGSAHVTRYVAWKFEAHMAKLAQPGHAFTLRDFYSGNTSIRTEVLREVGGFEELFTVYGNEDVELSLRLGAAGVELRYDEGATAYQHYTKSLRGLAEDTVAKGKTSVLLATTHPRTFDELQLSLFATAFPAWWRIVRASLLALTRREPRTTGLVLRLARLIESAGAWRRPYYYVLVLDYFYWTGVAAALADETIESSRLALLATDLRRGPIGLLLHR